MGITAATQLAGRREGCTPLVGRIWRTVDRGTKGNPFPSPEDSLEGTPQRAVSPLTRHSALGLVERDGFNEDRPVDDGRHYDALRSQ
jgi:hypothetical protein